LLRAFEEGGGPRLVFSEGRLWKYDQSGIWMPVPEADQSVAVQRLAGKTVRTTKGIGPLKVRSNDVIGSIRLAEHQRHNPLFFDGASRGVAFANGVAEVSATGITMTPPSPEQRIRVRYPFPYDTKASAPRFEAFLVEIFQGDRDYSDKIGLLQEFLGACILGQATLYQRCVVALGPGANGKGVLFKSMEDAMPAGTTSAIAPQLWNDQYRRARLVGVRLNVVSELPEQDILDSEAYKAVVSGDRIDARQIHKAPVDFRPIAGHLFAANRLPGTADHSAGFWRRPVIITFNRTFAPAEQDAGLADAIVASEIPGVVRWALEGAVRLLQRGRYVEPASSVEAVAAWRRTADPVALFVDECTVPLAPSAPIIEGVGAAKLYQGFKAWCAENGHRVMASNKFGQRMKLLGKEGKHTAGGNRYPVRFETPAMGSPGAEGL
jgi:putative DNA primase/helicase